MQNEIKIKLNTIDPIYKDLSYEKIPIEIRLAYIKLLFINFIHKINKHDIVDKFYLDDINFLLSDYLDNSSLHQSEDFLSDQDDDYINYNNL